MLDRRYVVDMGAAIARHAICSRYGFGIGKPSQFANAGVWMHSLCIAMIFFLYSSGWSLLKSRSFWTVPAAHGCYSLQPDLQTNSRKPTKGRPADS
jgi:hypothetical protein